MFNSSIQTIEQFKNILSQISQECYVSPCGELSEATIGQHTRHIIELYQCLIAGYDTNQVCYDKRERNKNIEESIPFAITQLEAIQEGLEKPNKELKVSYELGEDEVSLNSNYFREVMYNLEHAIHHHALIKVGIKAMTTIVLPDSFGVAPSTIQYRKVCVQ
ncbi:DinB family protein [uncultured Croceitalea sp.]|uniref:DinB family protein n=1 Tax=uncultured Croceitalea sp. TaxID=1798908 RepID=UPI003305F6D7